MGQLFDRLGRYLVGTYLKFYTLPALVCMLMILIATSYNREEYLGLVLLSYIATFSFFGLVQNLAGKHEFETLQCYGVSFGRLALPVLGIALGLQASVTAFAVVASGGSPPAIEYALWTFMSVVACCVITARTVWDQREPAALRACLRGFAAQTCLLLVWGIASSLSHH